MIAELHIATAVKHGITTLAKSFYTPPFKLADITEDKRKAVLRLMLMSSSPGVLDEDRYRIRLDLAEKSALELETQSYQRLFAMKKGATQQMEVHMDSHSLFTFLPLPVVPHKASHYTATNKIFLSGGCRLLWGEVLTCGRKLNGEVFSFSRFQNLTEVYLSKKLIIKENLLIEPQHVDVGQLGQWEGFTHQASLVYLDEKIEPQALIAGIINFLKLQEGIIYGVTTAPINGVIVRLLGNKAEPLYNILKGISKMK